MSMRFSCPECQAPVTVNEALAGLHTRCPACGASIVAPESGYAPARGQPAPAPQRYDAPPAWDEPEPYRRPAASGSWGAARAALTVEFVGALIYLLAFLGAFGVQCGTLMMVRPGGVNMGMFEIMRIVMILVAVAAISAVALMLVARFMACTAPSPGGHRGLAISAACCFALALMLFGAFVLIGVLTQYRRDTEMLGAVLVILAIVAGLAAHILWCLFLRGAAAEFGDHSLAVQHVVFLIVSVVLPLLVVGLTFLLVMTTAMRGGFGFGDGRGLAIGLFVLWGVVGLALIAWYMGLVNRTRDAIGRGPRSWSRSGGGYWEG